MSITSTHWHQVKGSSNTWNIDPKLAKQFKRYEIAEYPKFERMTKRLAEGSSIHMVWNNSTGVWEWEMSGWNWPWEDENEEVVEGYGYGTGIRRDADVGDGTICINHDWVNISFNHIHMACRHCGLDKPN